jgi:signal transduction histidine kinase
MTLGVRQWMMVGMLSFLGLPWFLYQIVTRIGERLFPELGPSLATVSAAVAMLLTLAFVGFQIGRSVVRPLEAMSEAARRMASGDLDFALPHSRAREIADVRVAFEALRDSLQASLRRQAELEEERRFFIGAVAHDLRTPLFALRGYLEGLHRGQSARRCGQRCRGPGRRAAGTLRDFR